jgi:hypothetical protein
MREALYQFIHTHYTVAFMVHTPFSSVL